MSQADAESILRDAIVAENKNDLKTAFELYEASLRIWMSILKVEKDPVRRNQLSEFISSYLTRVEYIKATLQKNQQQQQLQPSQNLGKSNNYNSDAATSVAVAKAAANAAAAARSKAMGTHNYHVAPQQPNNNTSSSSSVSAGISKAKTKHLHLEALINEALGTGISRSTGSGRNRCSPDNTEDDFPTAPTNAPAVTPSSSSTTAVVKGNGVTAADLSEYEKSIMGDMLDSSPGVTWDDIAGLTQAKQILHEAVVLPNLRPDLFTGLRSPPKGVLLFGPPGTGKTLLAKAVATESKFCFFSIKASSIASKWLGEGEKLMKALFTLARKLQPAVIFFDEIDSLLSSRKENEHEASRRIKTEFMVQVDGAGSSDSSSTSGGAGTGAASGGRAKHTNTNSNGEVMADRVLVMGATNIPWELDEAVLRRLVKRVYVPLPDAVARAALINHLLLKQHASSADSSTDVSSSGKSAAVGKAPNADPISGFVAGVTSVFSKQSTNSSTAKQQQRQTLLDDSAMAHIVELTDGYSGSDLTAVCHEAAMGPIRELTPAQLQTIKSTDIRGINEKDYEEALKVIRPSVTASNLAQFTSWAAQFGTAL